VRATLKDAKKLAEINADASGIPVRKARAQLDQATLKAPVAGVVTSAAHDGDLLAPGASAVTIRTSEPSQVSAWLSPAQAARSCSGDAVQLTGDWMPAGTSVPGSVTWLGTGYQYPPTDSTTDEIHLTRALQARISTQQAHLPAGVPVDISITGCHAAATTDTNG
jgi:multidrug efflux pump subunit AcrA (membrane-fusion protein)